MSSSNVINSVQTFLARHRYKRSGKSRPIPIPCYMRWGDIQLKPFGKGKPTEYQFEKYMRFLGEYALALSIVVDEEGVIIAGEMNYLSMNGYEPGQVPVYMLPGFSKPQRVAFRQAYARRGGYNA